MPRAGLSDGVLGIGFVLVYHAGIVAAAQVAPVLAPVAAADIGVDPREVSVFTAIIFAVALVSSNGTAGLLARYGSLPAAAASLITSAAGLFVLALAEGPWGAVAAAVLIGISYGPVNPVGSRVIARLTSGRRQNLIFSLKQSSVAIGAAATAAALPAIALVLGWRAAVISAAMLCIGTALLALPAAARLGSDGDPGASVRFAGPFTPAMAMLRDPVLRGLAIAVATFSMAQFGFMSVYVTMLWRLTGVSPGVAAGMLSIAMAASIAGRLFWGWRADNGNPRRVLALLAASGALVLALSLGLSEAWRPPALTALSLALGLGPMSWSGVLLSEVARAGAARAGAHGVTTATAGTMVFAYLGGLLGPGLLALSSSFTGGYGAGIGVIAAGFVATALQVGQVQDARIREGSE